MTYIHASFYSKAPVWADQYDAPNTKRNARPIQSISVKNASVIEVVNAEYRNATLNGCFLLAESDTANLPSDGMHKIEVLCCWFGLRLKTRGPHFKVNMATATVHSNYTGKVVSNIGI